MTNPVLYADVELVRRGMRSHDSVSFKKTKRCSIPLFSTEFDPLDNVISHGGVWMELLEEKFNAALTEADRSYYKHEIEVLKSILDDLNEKTGSSQS